MKERTQAFDGATKVKIKDSEHIILEGSKTQPYDWNDHPFDEDPDFTEEFHEVISNNELKEADDSFTPDVYDSYLNMELAIPQGDSLEPRLARVTKRLKDANGLPIGLANENPILDTRMYEVEYLDGERASLAANNIAENLFAQIDDEGNHQVLMDEIIGHRSKLVIGMIDELFVLELRPCVWVRDRVGFPDEGEQVLQHALMFCRKFGA